MVLELMCRSKTLTPRHPSENDFFAGYSEETDVSLSSLSIRDATSTAGFITPCGVVMGGRKRELPRNLHTSVPLMSAGWTGTIDSIT